MSGTRGAESGALVASPLLRAPGRSTFQSHPFSCMAWSASRGRRSSSVGSCGACKLRASTTTCCPCGSRGACECAAGLRGLQGREGGPPGLPPTSTALPSTPGGRGGKCRLRRVTGPQGLDPSPRCSPGPSPALQIPELPPSLPLYPLPGPEPQAEESRRERGGGRECSDGCSSSSTCLSVCLSVFLAVSVALAGPSWVLCQHSDFRGRQWLVGSCEITSWLTYSGTQRVGSLYPIKQVGSMSG